MKKTIKSTVAILGLLIGTSYAVEKSVETDDLSSVNASFSRLSITNASTQSIQFDQEDFNKFRRNLIQKKAEKLEYSMYSKMKMKFLKSIDDLSIDSASTIIIKQMDLTTPVYGNEQAVVHAERERMIAEELPAMEALFRKRAKEQSILRIERLAANKDSRKKIMDKYIAYKKGITQKSNKDKKLFDKLINQKK